MKLFFSFVLMIMSLVGVAYAQEDYLLSQYQILYVSPGGEGISEEEGPGFHLKYWNVPPCVRPGEKVICSISWETLGMNPNAVVFATIYGNWNPEQPLAQLHQGLHGHKGTVIRKKFEFIAPSEPGVYRLRWIYAMAFAPVASFYGQEHGGAHRPGGGWWSEVAIVVLENHSESKPLAIEELTRQYLEKTGININSSLAKRTIAMVIKNNREFTSEANLYREISSIIKTLINEE